ncbi:hypothetical protein [Serratia phage X20]|uniref:Uncharacterized protein n=1 Tax=Serratia phage X20 TaxID=2006942 RepID=A0A1Z1LZ28_9CAUD|nr:hypothetical protein KNT72_gp113 [Serratia phage X20]ARW58086.1 hypothetical protein [Serratia phage X20]
MNEFLDILKKFEDSVRATEEANCDCEISMDEWRTREAEADVQRQILVDLVGNISCLLQGK